MNYGKYTVGIRLMLLKQFLEANAGKDRYVTRGEIEKYLTEKGFPVEKKTLYRDFEFLQADFGLQLEYDVHKKGYRLLNPPFEPYELRLMVDGIQSSKFITREKAREITAKIKTLAGKDTVASLNRQAYVADRVRSMNDSVVKDADRIHAAIAQDSKIGFRYFHYTPSKDNPKKYSKSGNLYIVSPYALLWDNGNYYLYAYLDEKRGFRTFRIDRMERITKPLTEERDGEREFKADQITSREYKVFQMYHGEKVRVRVRFSNHLADAVIDQFGKEVMLIPIDERHFTVNLPVELSPPFFAWLATFGRGAKILTPATAVEEMRKFIEKVADMYKNDGEK